MNTPEPAVSPDWILSLLAGMRFPEVGGAYDFIKRSLSGKLGPSHGVIALGSIWETLDGERQFKIIELNHGLVRTDNLGWFTEREFLRSHRFVGVDDGGSVLHRLWGFAANQPGYTKSDWKALQRELWSLQAERDELRKELRLFHLGRQ